MPETQKTSGKKRWLGYTCPDCRMIFRIEAGYQGQRAQCPGCHAIVLLAGEGVVLPAPVDAEPKEIYSEAVIQDATEQTPLTYMDEGGGLKRRVAILGPAMADQDDLVWERAKPHSEVGNTALAVLLLVVLTFVGGVGYLVYGMVREDLRSDRTISEAVRIEGVKTAVGDLLRSETEEPRVLDLELVAELPRIRKAVQEFLAAPTVDEMLGRVRHRDRLEPVIRNYYEGRDFGFAPVRKIAPKGKVQTVHSLFSVNVEFEDFSARSIAVELVDGGYLVDWESWVGYSEVGWADFLKSRSGEPRLFRARCSMVDYYNFGFSDDGKWKSFRLESPDGRFLIFGYAERTSSIALDLTPPSDDRKEKAVMVRLRFPENPRSRNQVIISEFLGGGWVTDDGEN